MLRKPLQKPPRWWSPKLSPFWVRFWRPFRRARQRSEQRLEEIDVRGLERLEETVAKYRGVMITPNHPGSADAYVMYHVADRLDRPFFFMAAWQLFGSSSWLVQQILRHHGVFSVDREGVDLRAFKQAVTILASGEYPLVVFPEGEVYHTNDRVTPFREGPATIALSAARRAKRPVAVVPAAIKYHYLEDPTPRLLEIMDELEQQIFWRPRRNVPLAQRIYCFAEGPLALKELEYLGKTCAGPLPTRVTALREHILERLENRYGTPSGRTTVPERIKAVRQRMIKRFENLEEGDPARRSIEDDLDDVFFAVQLFTYPGDYVAESPSIERVAETLDKFAEDVLAKSRASVCAARKVTVSVGELAVAEPERDKKEAAPALTRLIEERVQGLLDEIGPPPDRKFG